MAGMLTLARNLLLPAPQPSRHVAKIRSLYGIYSALAGESEKALSTERMEDEVSEQLAYRCQLLLKNVHTMSLQKPFIEMILDPKDMHYVGGSAENTIVGEEGVEELKRRLVERVGYAVDRRESNVPNAGYGLFLRGAAYPGDVLAFMPGTIFLPMEHHKIPGYPKPWNEKLYLCRRPDEVIIDSSDDHGMKRYSFLKWDEKEKNGRPNPYWEWINPYASGHYANHPPPGVPCKAIAYPVDLENSKLRLHKIRRFAPYDRLRFERSLVMRLHEWAEMPEAHKYVQCMVLVATEEIEDNEEIFRNYHFNPKLKNIPDWYVDPEPETTKTLWGLSTELGENKT